MLIKKLSLILTLCSLFFLSIETKSAWPDRDGDGLPDRPEGSLINRNSCLDEASAEFTVSPEKINFGQSATLTWTVDMPTHCTNHVRFALNGKFVDQSGSQVITPSATSIYKFTLGGNNLGIYQQSELLAKVDVNYQANIIIDKTTNDPASALVNALKNPSSEKKIIELCDVDIDLTNQSTVVIGSNTSLIASPACVRTPHILGFRIFITKARSYYDPVFNITGNNVLISGFRLEGPTKSLDRWGDGSKERGIAIHPQGIASITNIEVSNMEIYHWSGAAIGISDNQENDEKGYLNASNMNAIHITKNFIHDNKHGNGYGYGVNIGGGAYALITKNVFDGNRHAIAGGAVLVIKLIIQDMYYVKT
ncbi:hypothetical protein [Thiothrix subterranea]|uniref:hypothetical protein n=1 Tax=Thiothrix subterranea TaxID=2735563 RepID=UPI00280BE01D|nr:hypothetical protein [Thiothrix subterranea]